MHKRTVLYKDDKVEIVLIHWPPGYESEIHGHPGKDCTVYLIDGILYEFRDKKIALQLDKPSFINDEIGKHQMFTPYGESARSVHVYRSKL